MKKIFALLLTFVLLLGLCACGQETEPTTQPNAESSEPIPESTAACSHTFADATCMTPKTCSLCGITEGEPAEHRYTEGVCETCGQTLFAGNRWITRIARPADYSEEDWGNVLTVLILNAGQMQSYSFKDYYSAVVQEMTSYDQLTHNGKTYYDYSFSGVMGGMSYTENGDTVTLELMNCTGKITLNRTGKTQFTVAVADQDAFLPVGTVLDLQAQ